MKIAYAVHGYGRGHAIRSSAILSYLKEDHKIKVITGGDSIPLLDTYDLTTIPILSFHIQNGKLDRLKTLKTNAPIIREVVQWGKALDHISDTLVDFQPDLVISDSEPLTLKAARNIRIPTMMVDNFTVMANSKLKLPIADALEKAFNVQIYRQLMGETDFAIGSTFYQSQVSKPKSKNVVTVGSILTDEVRNYKPTNNEHILVYLAKDKKALLKKVLSQLDGLGLPIKVYPSDKEETVGNVTYCKVSRTGFLKDLSSCSVVVSTAGNQLMGECRFYGKPVVVIPEPTLEQRINSIYTERMGIGYASNINNFNKYLVSQAMNLNPTRDMFNYTKYTSEVITEQMYRLVKHPRQA